MLCKQVSDRQCFNSVSTKLNELLSFHWMLYQHPHELECDSLEMMSSLQPYWKIAWHSQINIFCSMMYWKQQTYVWPLTNKGLLLCVLACVRACVSVNVCEREKARLKETLFEGVWMAWWDLAWERGLMALLEEGQKASSFTIGQMAVEPCQRSSLGSRSCPENDICNHCPKKHPSTNATLPELYSDTQGCCLSRG